MISSKDNIPTPSQPTTGRRSDVLSIHYISIWNTISLSGRWCNLTWRKFGQTAWMYCSCTTLKFNSVKWPHRSIQRGSWLRIQHQYTAQVIEILFESGPFLSIASQQASVLEYQDVRQPTKYDKTLQLSLRWNWWIWAMVRTSKKWCEFWHLLLSRLRS